MIRAGKIKRKGTLIIFCTICLSFLFAGTIYAVKRMKVVPQKIGYKDVKFSSLKKKACGDCHESSMVNAHHATKRAVSGNCASCHKVSTKPGKIGVALKRDCRSCHKKSPHHKTKAALNKECTSCHDSPGLGDYNKVKPPSYKVSNITPTKNSCKNCHRKGTADGINVVDIKTAHHGIGLKPCSICHEDKNKSTSSVRVCERCHNVKAIHEVLPHVKKENCSGCHGAKTAAKPKSSKKSKGKK